MLPSNALLSALPPELQVNPLHYLPLVNEPAVIPETYELDGYLLADRGVCTAALTAFSLLALFWLAPPSSILFLGSVTLLGAGTGCMSLEVKRAEDKLDDLVVENYSEGLTLAAANRIATRPQLLRILLNRAEGSADGLNTLDKETLEDKKPVEGKRRLTGKYLSEIIFSSTASFAHPSDPRVEVQKMYIDAHPDPFTYVEGKKKVFGLTEKDPDAVEEDLDAVREKKSIFGLLEKDSYAVRYFLQSKKKLLPRDPAGQVYIWKQVTTESTIQLLLEAGFDINAQDENGWTPLMHWAHSPEVGHGHCAVVAINSGADVTKKNDQGQTARELEHYKTGVRPAYLQEAEELFSQEAPSKETSFVECLLGKPAVRKGRFTYEPDPSKWSRITIVASVIGIVGVIVSGSYLLPLGLVSHWVGVCVAGSVTFHAASFFEKKRGNWEAKKRAVDEYLEVPFPSTQAMNTICQDLEAAHMLIDRVGEKTAYLNKLSFEGCQTLLTQEKITFEVFQLLVDHGADLLKGPVLGFVPAGESLPSSFQHNGFLHAAGHTDPRFLSYIFEKKPEVVEIVRKSPSFQKDMWSQYVKSLEVANLLRANGFSPNVEDQSGETAWMYQATHSTPHRKERMKFLVSAGAIERSKEAEKEEEEESLI